MTINNVHVFASGRPDRQLVLAERSQAESMIAARAIRRLFSNVEVRPVISLAEAKGALAGKRTAAALVASGLDSRTYVQTICWIARKGCGIVIAILEECDDRHRQEAVEAGASYVWSKPELLVGQLRYELGARLRFASPERPRLLG